MNFAPSTPERVLHDTWVFIHDDVIHLFYLAPAVADPMHRLIGHAVSTNWLDWEELPFIELTGAPGSWDAGRIGTGHTFQHEDGRFYMAYTGRIDPREDVGLAVSDDLVHWEKLSVDSPVWPRAMAGPYETDSEERGVAPAWRDPYISRLPEGTWTAWLCAKSDGPNLAARACVARAQLDDLQQWSTLPPTADLGYYPTMEVPEVFELQGDWWLTFNVHSEWGRRLDTPSRRVAGGTFYLRSDSPEGPWERPDDNLLIGSGGNRHEAVVARSVMWHGERLVYHHYSGSMEVGTSRALGLPKKLELSGKQLVLRPWEGLTGLWTGEMVTPFWQIPDAGIFSSGDWTIASERLHGKCEAGAAAVFAQLESADIDIEATVCVESGERAGIAIGGDDCGRGALLVCIDARHGEITIGELRHGVFGPSLDHVLDTVFRPIIHRREYRIRILRRHRYAEVFLDEALVFSTVVNTVGAGNTAALVVDTGDAVFQIDRIHVVRPME